MQWKLFKTKNYQIRWLSHDQTEALCRAEIAFETNENGTFIGVDDLNSVLVVLEAEVVTTFASKYKRIEEVVLKFKIARGVADRYTVSFAPGFAQAAQHEATLDLIAEQFLPSVARDIVVHAACAEPRQPIDDGCFHIFVDSAAVQTECVKIPERLFGIPVTVPAGHAAFGTSGRGTVISDVDDGFVIGELLDNCLYLHFNVLGDMAAGLSQALLLRILIRATEDFSADDVLSAVLAEIGVEHAAHPNTWFDKPPKRFGKQILGLIRSVLSSHVGADVVVHMVPGAVAPTYDEKFHLYLYGAPEKTAGVNTPEQVFGLPVLDRRNAWAPVDEGIPVSDGLSRFACAQLMGMNCLYVLFGVFEGDLELQLKLLASVLTAALKERDVDGLAREVVESLSIGELNMLSRKETRGLGVAIDGFSDRRLELICSLADRLVIPVVGVDVAIENSWGENRKPQRDGRFHIYFQSSPLGDRNVKSPSHLFGVAVSQEEMFFYPSGRGLAIVDDNGSVVGELVEKNLYIFPELVRRGTRPEATILARLLFLAMKEFAACTGKAAGGRSAQVADLTEGFVGTCLDQVEVARSQETTPSMAEVTESNEALRGALTAQLRAETKLHHLETVDQFGPEYDELLAVDKVRDITVSDGWILVDTDTLYCVDERTGITHEIGEFQIQIPTGGGRLKWINRTRTCYGHDQQMYAPHIQTTGYACEGSTKDEWPHYIAARQFATVVMMAIAFVESANTNDLWGKHIDNWPIAHTA